MDAVNLLSDARAAGLVVTTRDGLLHVRGPKTAEAYISGLAAHKEAIIAILGNESALDWRQAAQNLIEQYTPDPGERFVLVEHFEKYASGLNDRQPEKSARECQAFGQLVTKILNLEVDRAGSTNRDGGLNLTPATGVTTIPGCSEHPIGPGP